MFCIRELPRDLRTQKGTKESPHIWVDRDSARIADIKRLMSIKLTRATNVPSLLASKITGKPSDRRTRTTSCRSSVALAAAK